MSVCLQNSKLQACYSNPQVKQLAYDFKKVHKLENNKQPITKKLCQLSHAWSRSWISDIQFYDWENDENNLTF